MRIAQITDFHTRRHMPGTSDKPERESRRMPDLLPVALERIRGEGVDFLAVTGDLIDAPDWLVAPASESPQSLSDEWAQWAEADTRLMRGIFDASGIPYMALPGNHDLPDAFRPVYGDTPDEIRLDDFRVMRFCDWEGAAHVPHREGAERRRWEGALNADGGDRALQIHLQHYVVLPAIESKHWPHNYKDAHILGARMAERSFPILSLSGHYHPGTEIVRQGKAVFTTCPAFCEAPFRFRIYEVAIGAEGALSVKMQELDCSSIV